LNKKEKLARRARPRSTPQQQCYEIGQQRMIEPMFSNQLVNQQRQQMMLLNATTRMMIAILKN